MTDPKKTCEKCAESKSLIDFEGKIYDGEQIFTAPVCNTCRHLSIKQPLALAKQQYFAAVDTLVVLGFGTRSGVCRAERLQREYGMTLERIQKKHIDKGREPDDEKVFIEWYNLLTKNIHNRIKRVNGVPKVKPRPAKRKVKI